MRIRRLSLDIDKARARPDVFDLAAVMEAVPGVEAVSLAVTEIDLETVGMDVVIEGDQIDHVRLIEEIEATGAVVRSVDEIALGDRIVPRNPSSR